MQRGPSWQATVVAIALIALTGYMFGEAVHSSNFTTIWAAVGILVGGVVGVVVGAIPAFFFRADATTNRKKADALQTVADEQTVKKAAALAPDVFPGIS
jgi:hypothetical protein